MPKEPRLPTAHSEALTRGARSPGLSRVVRGKTARTTRQFTAGRVLDYGDVESERKVLQQTGSAERAWLRKDFEIVSLKVGMEESQNIVAHSTL